MSNRDERAGGFRGELAGSERDLDSRDTIPVPRYEAEQYLPRADHIMGANKAVLRREFGYVRTFFKARPERHFTLQRKLNQARLGTTYDLYLTRSVWLALALAVIAGITGVVLSMSLATAGVFDGLGVPFAVPTSGVLGSVVLFFAANKATIGAGLVTLGFAGTAGAATWYGRYYYPYTVANARRRNINITLPHVIVYMYALSFGGMAFIEVLRRTAATEDTYGEVANEFDLVVKDTEMFGSDLYTALRNARNLTPSDSMEQFLDDLLSVLDSGGDITEFLREEAEKYMDEATREQESFLDTLETLSEVFIVGFVAAPLFLVVTLLMMSFLGGDTLQLLFVLVYAVLPLGMLAFLVLIATISEPYRQPEHELDLDAEFPSMEPSADLRDHAGYQMFYGLRLRDRIRAVIDDPVLVLKRQPLYTLLLTVPAAVLLAAYLWTQMGGSFTAFFDRPFAVGTALVVVPFLIVTAPLTAFYEVNQRRKQRVTKRLPDTLDILASSNQMGVPFVEGLGMVSRSISGEFAGELRRVRNDIRWNGDIRHALLSLATRLQVPQLTRTCHILAEGMRSTGELHKVLSIAAEDTRQRYRLERNRRQELQAYTTIVIVGFLVYLGVIVILNYSFLGAISASLEGATRTADAGVVQIDLDELALYQALFFHSALVMAVGTGLISGKLTDNSILSGLKYSIALVVVTLVVFLIL